MSVTLDRGNATTTGIVEVVVKVETDETGNVREMVVTAIGGNVDTMTGTERNLVMAEMHVIDTTVIVSAIVRSQETAITVEGRLLALPPGKQLRRLKIVVDAMHLVLLINLVIDEMGETGITTAVMRRESHPMALIRPMYHSRLAKHHLISPTGAMTGQSTSAAATTPNVIAAPAEETTLPIDLPTLGMIIVRESLPVDHVKTLHLPHHGTRTVLHLKPKPHAKHLLRLAKHQRNQNARLRRRNDLSCATLDAQATMALASCCHPHPHLQRHPVHSRITVLLLAWDSRRWPPHRLVTCDEMTGIANGL